MLDFFEYRKGLGIANHGSRVSLVEVSGRGLDAVLVVDDELTRGVCVFFSEKIAYSSFDVDAVEYFFGVGEIVEDGDVSVVNHFVSECVESFSSDESTAGDNHREVGGVEFFGLFDEKVVDRACAGSLTTVTELIWRVSYDYIEFHRFVSSE